MTQEQLAEKAEIDTSYLGQIERGVRQSPSIAIVGKISRALGIGEGELLADREEDASYETHADEEIGIPERIARELGRMTPKEQRLYERIFRTLRELSELKD
ncbi:helix-turn-helix transcriptional regulator [Saccharibacillus brassicae]|uniref:Helix-turn-helix transcriptional regulator n=2 Tax=Saccharibacillus brassicae TaxID=2583377 RepID=A0A4Y6V148_SACBS|nr:helix-turn-helix transcriptional regulator [Saccharibacillus brassicae]